ncbi:rCG20069 [Rattus norvegicus]|uniref:RCG20069 n=1 Tax=Rattus norvegicus TaxID=10116 RepID=A6JGK7_RAT|nr:rCG20069 [Rattus norvegicus]
MSLLPILQEETEIYISSNLSLVPYQYNSHD